MGIPEGYLRTIFLLLTVMEETSVNIDQLKDKTTYVVRGKADLSNLQKGASKLASAFLMNMTGKSAEVKEEMFKTIEKSIREAEIEAEYFITQESGWIDKAIITTKIMGVEIKTSYHGRKMDKSEFWHF